MSIFDALILTFIFSLTSYLQRSLLLRALNVSGKSGVFRHDKNLKILDTNIIIDGRIANFCETGFVDGTLIVPRFILRELQQLADSPHKSERGRRGLDVITKMRKSSKVKILVDTREFPKIEKVDEKLVELSRLLGAKLLTSDFNLSKVAQFQGVEILNIHELASSLKTFILPGEIVIVTVVKRGKEDEQGVAYFEDGTMVVIDKGARFINKEVEIEITNVLQTPTGRMIFAKITNQRRNYEES